LVFTTSDTYCGPLLLWFSIPAIRRKIEDTFEYPPDYLPGLLSLVLTHTVTWIGDLVTETINILD
jgi:hypothetical protein